MDLERLNNEELLELFEERVNGFERETVDLAKVAREYESIKLEILKRMAD